MAKSCHTGGFYDAERPNIKLPELPEEFMECGDLTPALETERLNDIGAHLDHRPCTPPVPQERLTAILLARRQLFGPTRSDEGSAAEYPRPINPASASATPACSSTTRQVPRQTSLSEPYPQNRTTHFTKTLLCWESIGPRCMQLMFSWLWHHSSHIRAG